MPSPRPLLALLAVLALGAVLPASAGEHAIPDEAGLRAAGDYRAEKIGAKIRDAQLELTPYMFVIGGRELESRTVAVRDRLAGDLGAMALDDAMEKLQAEIDGKLIRQRTQGPTESG